MSYLLLVGAGLYVPSTLLEEEKKGIIFFQLGWGHEGSVRGLNLSSAGLCGSSREVWGCSPLG